jgi:hypothetical protein
MQRKMKRKLEKLEKNRHLKFVSKDGCEIEITEIPFCSPDEFEAYLRTKYEHVERITD